MLFAFLFATISFAPTLVKGSATTWDWLSLNKTIGNRLKAVTPLALPCFSEENGHAIQRNPQACSDIQAHYTDPKYRVDQFSAYIFPQSEICAPYLSQQCLLDPTNPGNAAAYTNVSCNQGSLPSYYIQVESAQDVKAAFAFAATTKTSISIKNSGHDYNGRSSGPDTLALWTRKLQNMTYNKSFVPNGCRGQVGIAAITTGAGVNFDQVYAFADANGVTFLGGSGPTVGASGGWVMTGGHSVLSRVYGLGIDRVLEFEVVTPDGQHRIANSCQNKDLFWALRGGGGSTFGVVLSTTHRVEPATPLSVAFIEIPSTSSPSVQTAFSDLMINSTLKLASQGWGGFRGSGVSVIATPLLSLSAAQSSVANLVAFATANGGSATVESLPTFYAMYTKYITSTAQSGGTMLFNHNWLIPSRLFTTAGGRQQLRDHMDWMSSVGLAPGFLDTTPYLYSGNGSSKAKAYAYGPPSSVSSTEAWRNSAIILITTASWSYNASVEDKKRLAKTLVEASDRAKALAPEGGAYANEAHPWVNDWQEAFWGRNYRELVRLKQKWDSKYLLRCWHCVGSEFGNAPEVVGGSCLGQLL